MSTQPEAMRLADLIESLTVQQERAVLHLQVELRRLHDVEQAYVTWQEKTEWVQHNIQGKELGKHRADVLRQRIERLHAEVLEQARLNGMGAEREARLMARVGEFEREVEALRKGLEAALDFAGTVGGGSSWWDDVWAEHDAAIDAARSKT